MKGPAEIAHGPMLIGTVLNVFLYGIMITQTYLYYTTYKRDRAWMKFLVFTVLVADTANTIFDIIYVYESVIIHFADVSFLQKANWRFATDPVMTGIIELMVQLFFSWRIWILTRNVIIAAVVVLLSLTAGACAIVTTYEITIIPEFVRYQEFKDVVIVWLVCASVADILITSTLVWYLGSIRRDSKVRTWSLTVLSEVLIVASVTMQTGLLTSMLAIVDLIVYLADPTGTHLIFNFPLCKLYSNSLMSSLNSRGGWRYDSSVTSGVHFGLPDKPATSHAFDEMKSGWNDDNRMVSPSSHSGKAQNLFNNMKGGIIKKPEVFVHVESHEMHDIEAPSTKRSSSDVQ